MSHSTTKKLFNVSRAMRTRRNVTRLFAGVSLVAIAATCIVTAPKSHARDCPPGTQFPQPVPQPARRTVDWGQRAAIRAMEAGTPIPAGACKIVFPWMGKQSIMCVGDSVERQIAFVDFTGDADAAPESGMLGSVAIDAQGNATGSCEAPAALLRSGDKSRDEKLQGGAWLDAESNPSLKLDILSARRVGNTVWDVQANWTMHGVTAPVNILANVQHIPEMQHMGKNIARVRGSFFIDLKKHEILNDAVGTPAVAQKWLVDVVLLGLIKPADVMSKKMPKKTEPVKTDVDPKAGESEEIVEEKEVSPKEAEPEEVEEVEEEK